MKVVYDETIIQKVQRAHVAAMRENRSIRYVEVTLDEALELLRELERSVRLFWQKPIHEFEHWARSEEFCWRHGLDHKEPQPSIKLLGIPIKVSR